MCQNSAIESRKLHAVDAILDELKLKKAPLLRSFIGLWTTTGYDSISPIPHSKGYRFSFILKVDVLDIWGRFAVVVFFASFRLKSVLATRDVCKRPRCLHHWNQHSISDPVIPHIAVYNAYGFVTEQINTLTVFVHVSDRGIGTTQMENTSRRKSVGNFSRHMQCKHKHNHTNEKKMFFLFI